MDCNVNHQKCETPPATFNQKAFLFRGRPLDVTKCSLYAVLYSFIYLHVRSGSIDFYQNKSRDRAAVSAGSFQLLC